MSSEDVPADPVAWEVSRRSMGGVHRVVDDQLWVFPDEVQPETFNVMKLEFDDDTPIEDRLDQYARDTEVAVVAAGGGAVLVAAGWSTVDEGEGENRESSLCR